MSQLKTVHSLHQALNLYISPDAYVFEPVASPPPDEKGHAEDKETLVVDRATGHISLNPPNRHTPVAHEEVSTVYGILGIISLVTTDYIIVITHKSPSSRFLGHDISLATAFRLLPLSNSTLVNPPPLETYLLKLVTLGLHSGQIWFSYTWDLTNTLERQWRQDKARGGRGKGGAAERADDRFFWNKSMMRRFLEVGSNVVGGDEEDQDLGRFILPVMYGSFELRQAFIGSRPFLFCLISRRSRHRAGTRFFTRGIDHDGNTANYVETEQIVLLDRSATDVSDEKSILPPPGGSNVEGRERFSFVQIRGSAPIFWTQINNLRYTPDLQVMDLPETTSALRTHLSEQITLYGSVYLVNLVNQVKYERPVKEAFENAMIVLDEPKAKYVYFDFHKECKGMRFDRVNVLVDQLREGLDEEGYFHLSGPVEATSSSIQPRKVQSSVIRTNCMDSLDRTNVVQSALAKYVMDKQLRSAGVLAPNDTVENHPEFMSVFRNVWADHADSVSNAYSGTGALKTDATRTGKRTKQGVLKDGWNSVVRYVKNNYMDGPRQDALDLLTGSCTIRRGALSPLLDMRPLLTRIMPYVLLVALALCSASLQFSYWVSSRHLDVPLLSFWGLIALVSFVYIWANGIQYVSWPRLNPPNEVLSYEGPGFRTPPHGRGLKLRFKGGRAARVIKGGVDVVQGAALAVGTAAVPEKRGRHGRLD